MLVFAFLLITCNTYSQEYTYVHYDAKDGLAGSTVYDICQDKDGFIWFSTEAGVSRFDGTHFKNFTISDGLPETEVLKLYPDSKGRVWMAPFKNTICYFYKGKIYNQDNDSLLKKIKLTAIIVQFKEDIDNNIAINSGEDITIINPDSAQKDIITLHPPAKYPYFSIVETAKPRKGFIVAVNRALYTLIGAKLSYLSPYPIEGVDLKSSIDTMLLQKIITANRYLTTGFSYNGERMLFVGTFNGAYMIDTLHPDHLQDVFLKGKPISRIVVDDEKNIWFSTLGQGVYKLISREFRTLGFEDSKRSEIFSIEKQDGQIIAGGNFGNAYRVNGLQMESISFSKYFAYSGNNLGSQRLIAIKRVQSGDLILGFDGILSKYSRKETKANYMFPVKSIDEIDAETILVGTGRKVTTVSLKDFQPKDTIWPYRATAVCYYDNCYYIGTVDGLYIKNKNKPTYYAGDGFPALRYRTSFFAKPKDGNLWIATYGGGIVCMKGNRPIKQLTTEDGLTSNICRTLFAQGNFLWVGTDKGLNKIDINNPGSRIIKYTTADGLPSDFINAIYADSNNIYVGSPAGLTWFNEFNVSDYSKCDLKVLDISFSNKSRLNNSYQLPFKNNNVKISFVAISFRSAGDILYRYRLKGLRRSWDSTHQTVLEYPSLPPGNYELELIAINKFGVSSNRVYIPFTIETPFWQSLWFQVLVIAIAILITWLLVAWRFRIARKEEREKTDLQQRMSDLEQMALRSQMNPHFIFNCLNSIQNFIINNKLEATNWYLTEFAHLIRQTLDNSDKGAISLSNEIQYLKRYLELEKMRFGNSFEYKIETDPALDKDFVRIPPMILQPYVENSIRHGIRNRKGKEGLIEVKFQQKNNALLCIVQDNGIGRKRANELKSHIHVEYQSKGMTLTAERINILNRQFTEPITIEIVDMEDSANANPTGTKVIIHFPFNNLDKLK